MVISVFFATNTVFHVMFICFLWGGDGCGRKGLGLSCFFCCLKKEKGLLPSPETSRLNSLIPLTRFTSTHFLYCYTSLIKMAQFVHTESQWIPFQGKKKQKNITCIPQWIRAIVFDFLVGNWRLLQLEEIIYRVMKNGLTFLSASLMF